MTTASFSAARFAPVILIAVLGLGGCATTTHNPDDPLEPVNRFFYQVNDKLDRYGFKPLAQSYKAVLPQIIRTGVTNFFDNLNDVVVAVNDLLQGKLNAAAQDVTRVMVNSTVGVGGLIDMGSQMGLEKHDEDFGQTLGYWGIGAGPYLQLPLFGPSDVRDAVGRVGDYEADPIRWGLPHDIPIRNILWGIKLVNTRANLLDASQMLEDAALDPYEFQRDAYLQMRESLVHDGNVARDDHSSADDASYAADLAASAPGGAPQAAPVSATPSSAPAAPAGQPTTDATPMAPAAQPAADATPVTTPAVAPEHGATAPSDAPPAL